MLRDYVERFLLANASKAVLSRCWEQLGQDFRKKICSSSFVGYDKFGNKIVKNTGGGATGSAAKSKTTRPTSSSSRNPSVSKQASVPTKPTQAVTASASVVTKVASVRPMQSQQQQNVHPTTNTVPVPQKRSVRPISSSGNKSGSGYETQSSPPTATPRSTSNLRTVPKAMSVDREKSFNSRRASISTASSTASANRTPIKPLTPSVPSKPSPLTGYDQVPSSTTTPRNTKSTTRSQAHRTQKPTEPPKKTFVSNSAKAAAVSKPLLKPASNKRTQLSQFPR